MTQRKTGFFWGKSTKSMNCKLKFCVMHAGRNKRCIYVWRVFAKETGGCVKTASKLMSAERECFCRFAIRRGWESAATVKAISIQTSLFRMCRKFCICCIAADKNQKVIFMHLPYSENLEIQYLSRIFDNTSECYKFFWFQAILSKVLEGKRHIFYIKAQCSLKTK